MSEIMDFNENHNSVRQKIGEPGSKSIRNIFPLHPVTSKRPESPYGATSFFLAENPVFQFFCLEIPYRTRVGPYRKNEKNAHGKPIKIDVVEILSSQAAGGLVTKRDPMQFPDLPWDPGSL